MRLAVIGVPYNSAGLAGGEATAPTALRRAGLIEALVEDHDVRDLGDVELPPPTPSRDPLTGIIAPDVLLAAVDRTAEAVGTALAGGRLPIVLGGECPLLLGCLMAARAHARSDVGLLFVDGHEDAYPPHRSTSGEAADMELGLALDGRSLTDLPELSDRLPLMAAEDAIVLGARDRAEIEGEGVTSIGDRVTVLDDVALRARGMEQVADRWVAEMERRGRRHWMHLDVDVLSSEALPAVRYPQPGGLDWDELAALGRVAAGSWGLVGMDVTIYNPELDPTGDGATMIVHLIRQVLSP